MSADIAPAAHPRLRVLLVSTPVGPLGSGRGGGVELTLYNLARELGRRGYQVRVIAPAGSVAEDLTLTTVSGELQPYAQYQGRDAPILLPPSSVLGAMWEEVNRLQADYDLILNFAYDWLPLYLTRFISIPVLHLISMSSLSDAMDSALDILTRERPGYLAVHTHAQAQTFAFVERLRVIGSGLDFALYPYTPTPTSRLCWVGRIAPEKGLEDAVRAAQQASLPLDVCGAVIDDDYWRSILRAYGEDAVTYHGFLSTAALAAVLGASRALLLTPKWIEAFGNVAIEALACGTPVIAYGRGGPAEIVEHGRTGWLVEPDDVNALVTGISRVALLERMTCRRAAEERFSLAAWTDRVETWFADVLTLRADVTASP